MRTLFRSLVIAGSIGAASMAVPAFAQDNADAPTVSFREAEVTTQTSGTVQTDAGPVSGVERKGMMTYLGIPFAAPPVGDLRWRPPQPLQPWTAVRKASTFASDCAQNADLGVFARAGGNEDCLYLNVFSARDTPPNAKRPVFVWIYGGSLFVGSARDYDPVKLALDGGAVVVTFNYRVGLFGYFSHPAIDGEGHDVANYGFMDQQATLDWVQRNIGRFGGDPGNVTISGESSGGNSVLSHVVSPTSAGKFQHAIAMSGGAVALNAGNFGAPLPLTDAQGKGTAFAAAVGCADRGSECLRALPAKRVLDEQTPFLINQIVVDGKVMPERPSEAFKSGRFNRVTLVNGNTRDEGRFFAGLRENLTGAPLMEADYASALETYFGTEMTPKVVEAYPPSGYASASEAYAASVTDYLFACSGLAVTRWAAQHAPVYSYEFADGTAPSYLEPTTFPLAAAHTYELPYLFPGFRGGEGRTVELNSFQESLSARMVKDWTGAARMAGRNDWTPYDPANDNVMDFVLPAPRMTERSYRTFHKCDFWDASGVY